MIKVLFLAYILLILKASSVFIICIPPFAVNRNFDWPYLFVDHRIQRHLTKCPKEICVTGRKVGSQISLDTDWTIFHTPKFI